MEQFNILTTSKQNRIDTITALNSLGLIAHGVWIGGHQVEGTPKNFEIAHPWESFPVLYININGSTYQISGTRDSGQKNSSVGVVIDAILKGKSRKKIEVVFPAPAKYTLKYEKSDGEIKEYVVSNPIESSDKSITVYAFEHGIRSFIKEQILSLTKI